MAPTTCWIPGGLEDPDFSVHNIPFGLVSLRSDSHRRPATRIADTVVLLDVLHAYTPLQKALDAPTLQALTADSLEAIASLPLASRRALRLALQHTFALEERPSDFPADSLASSRDIQVHLPLRIGDYTDYCIAVEHMINAGRAVSGNPSIPPQMPFMPIGYHGRASSIVASGTSFKRPCGFYKADPKDEEPILAPTRKLDYEVEMAFFVSGNTTLGTRLTIQEADEHIFGVVLMNDWSARDIQGYEMTPLGPFQGKNFATTISPWVVTLDALEPFLETLPERIKPEMGVLQSSTARSLDVHLQAKVRMASGEEAITASEIRATDFYWSVQQLLVHQTLSGCPVNTGDLIATGTCSGKTEASLGSLVETTLGGRKPWHFPSGEPRTFIADGDTVTLTGRCSRDGINVGFGECSGTVLEADAF